jgi:hypothetical protein
MKALLISILLLSTQAHANTAYDTLRQAFDKASTPAKIHDFDEGNYKSCVYSDVANPLLTHATQVRTLQYMTGPGQGPLFPGNNDFRIDVFFDYNLDRNIVAFFQASTVEEDGVNFRQVINGPGWKRMNIYGRTDADMLLFYVEVSDYYGYQAPMYPRVYGYCWNDAPTGNNPGDDEGDEQPLPLPAPN